MRLFIAIVCLLSASVSFAGGITSKTDFIIYKNPQGSSTIPIPDWELVIDDNSLAGKKSLPVPKSNESFNATLRLPRGQLLSSLAKYAKLSPHVFVSQGLIDLVFDQIKQQFMVRDPVGGTDFDVSQFEQLLKRCYPDKVLKSVCPVSSDRLAFYTVDRVAITVTLFVKGYSDGTRANAVDVGGRCVVERVPYSRFPQLPSCIEMNQYQLRPATDAEIAQNLNKNVDSKKLPVVRDLVESQGWTLETDQTPTVTGPSEVVTSTSTRTRYNPDGTTTTETVVEKSTYTYNKNVITENHVTQIFHGDQLVENTVTQVGEKTETGVETGVNTEQVDYTFQPPGGQYPTDLNVPEKRDLVSDVLNPVASQLQDFGSKIGLRGSGQCSFDIPFTLGPASGSGRLDFCQYQSTFSTLGSMFVTFAYLMAGLIVLGMRN